MNMTGINVKKISILSGGAAKGLVGQVMRLQADRVNFEVDGHFGAVGAMRNLFLQDEPCDVLILTRALIDALEADGRIMAGSVKDIGSVATGVAVKSGEAAVSVQDADALRAVLLAASEIYFPDPERATAGIHFRKVMAQLGVHEQLQPRFRTYPNGALAMAALAGTAARDAIGCTQVTEILYTDGVTLVGNLPDEHALSTIYTAAIPAHASNPLEAGELIGLLTHADFADVRKKGGFALL